MSKFFVSQNADGAATYVNLDQICYITPQQGGMMGIQFVGVAPVLHLVGQQAADFRKFLHDSMKTTA